jgi:hypothetical protein
MKATYMSINRLTGNDDTYTHSIIQSFKGMKLCFFAVKWMELEIITGSEIKYPNKDKYHIFPNLWKTKQNKRNELQPGK